MKFAPGLTSHSVVVCCEKRERGLKIQAILSKTGYKVVMAFSLYEALRAISQEMPHLVITESILSDGSAGTLYDRLKQHETLCKTPILVHVVNKTRAELEPLAQRQFAGFFLGKFDPKAFFLKVKDIIESHSLVSPYFVHAEAMELDKGVQVSIEAHLMGRMRDSLVCRADFRIDPEAELECTNEKQSYPATLTHASCLEISGEVFNLFPLNRVTGRGRKWIMELPDISKGEGVAGESNDQNRKILMVMENSEYVEGYQEILAGFEMEVVQGKSVIEAAQAAVADPTAYGCIYIHDFEEENVRRQFHNLYCQIEPKVKPPVIVGIIDKNVPKNSGYTGVSRPFGLGRILELFEASFERAEEVARVASKSGPNARKGRPVVLGADASLVGLDEVGGIIETKYPIVPDTRLNIQNKFLQKIWNGNQNILVTASSQVPNKPEVWQVRFESVAAGTSKAKYWDSIYPSILTIAPSLAKIPEEAEDQDLAPVAEEDDDLSSMNFDDDELGMEDDLDDDDLDGFEDSDLDAEMDGLDIEDDGLEDDGFESEGLTAEGVDDESEVIADNKPAESSSTEDSEEEVGIDFDIEDAS